MKVAVVLAVVAFLATAWAQTCSTRVCASYDQSCAAVSGSTIYCPYPSWSLDAANGTCICKATSQGLALGADCDLSLDTCGFEKICSAVPGSAISNKCYGNKLVGDKCSDPLDCKPPRTCNSGVCAATLTDKQSCVPGVLQPAGACPATHYCSPTTQTCTIWPSVGLQCETAVGCKYPSQCVGGACVGVQTLEDGTASTSPYLCKSLFSSAGVCAAVPSDALTSVGKVCSTDTECTIAGICGCTENVGANSKVCRANFVDFDLLTAGNNLWAKVFGECEEPLALMTSTGPFDISRPSACVLRIAGSEAHNFYCAAVGHTGASVTQSGCESRLAEFCGALHAAAYSLALIASLVLLSLVAQF